MRKRERYDFYLFFYFFYKRKMIGRKERVNFNIFEGREVIIKSSCTNRSWR